MSLRYKFFFTTFSILLACLWLFPIFGRGILGNITLQYYVACMFFSLATAGVISVTLHFIVQKDLNQVHDFVKELTLGKLQRRLAGTTVTAQLVTPINALATHFETRLRDLSANNEQLRTILNAMDEGVLVLTQSGAIEQYNKALLSMFPQVEHFQGSQVVEVIPVPGLQQAVDNILSACAHKEFDDEKSYDSLRLELDPHRVFSVHVTRASHSDLALGAVVVFHDISAIVRLERVRRDFVANVSHELRTPLTVIQGYAETLASTEDFPLEYKRFVEIIGKNGAYLARMVEELLSLARLENTHLPITLSAVSAQESLQAAIALCRLQLDLRQIQVKVDFEEDILLVANAQHLTQVFRNLLENAGRYAPEGDEIVVRCQSIDSNIHKDDAENNTENAGMTIFSICDKGIGIAEKERRRIFERFYRVEKHRRQGSTGLGLAICKHTVERLGGRIWVESPADEFATVFYFTIPTFFGE